MTIIGTIVLFGWIPLALVFFATMPARRAVLMTVIGGWLFMPMAGYALPGLPNYTKMVGVPFAALLGTIVFDGTRLASFRPCKWDLPILAWCLCPMVTSLSNDLGAYDGLSAVLTQVLIWGIPYVLGRVYFNDHEGLRELAVALVVGGVVYLPLCLWEIRMSPHLHKLLYGFHQHSFGQTKRWGGYRPMVFMQHGLMVGMWMCTAALAASWLWMSGTIARLWRFPIEAVAWSLLITAVLCKSTGALLLLGGGIAVPWIVRRTGSVWPLAALLAVAPTYMFVRASGIWSGEGVVSSLTTVSEERTDSLRVRLNSENLLMARAWQQPVFGWGGWSRARVTDERGRDLAITDGLWIIAFGERGLVGLTALTAAILLPAARVLRMSPRKWLDAGLAATPLLATILSLHMIDNLMNAMVNPAFILAAGGLAGLKIVVPASHERARPAMRRRVVVVPSAVRVGSLER
jgi:hypothetical protein